MGSNLDSYHVSDIPDQYCLSDDVTSMSDVFNVTCVSQPGVNVPRVNNVCCDIDSQNVCTGATLHNPSRHATKYFYHSRVDRRTIEGLLAKGNKAKALQLNNRGDRIRTRTFVSRSPIVACYTSTTPHLTGCKLHSTQCISTEIASDPLCEQNNDIVKSKGIVCRANIWVEDNCTNIGKGVYQSVHELVVTHENNHVKEQWC